MKIRVLLTGGSGMVGRNFREHPKAREFDVLAPGHGELDLLNFAAVKSHIGSIKPDVVVHAAGKVGGIHANIREPVHFLLDNLDMGRNVVWAARLSGVRRLLNLGSSCMYPRNSVNPLPEELIMQGELDPSKEGYALAKIAVAKLCEYISREDPEFRYKTLIPCNMYGRHDKFSSENSHLIASAIHKVHMAKINGRDTVEIWGDGTARREFIFADDMADCLLEAIKRFDALPSNMNVGAGRDRTINEYYAVAAEVVGWKGRFIHDLTKPVGMRRNLVSVDRQTAWGWEPKTGLREGIKKTYEYYLSSNQS